CGDRQAATIRAELYVDGWSIVRAECADRRARSDIPQGHHPDPPLWVPTRSGQDPVVRREVNPNVPLDSFQLPDFASRDEVPDLDLRGYAVPYPDTGDQHLAIAAERGGRAPAMVAGGSQIGAGQSFETLDHVSRCHVEDFDSVLGAPDDG